MKTNSLNVYHLLALILGTITTTPTNAQPITPANDGTGTTVNQNGNHINIQGGTRSRDGTNLFHSFDQFNLKETQTANFHSTPDTRNILGRVTGGDASYINGLIQVIGGNSNLFLMNPAGIMFGSNASLNIPASFSVTTATGIGFANNNYWFQAIGTNNYANLVGNPSGYHFNVSNPGAIVNEGNLTLNPGENLTLLGGTVINTGQLSTAGGNITIAAVEGSSTLKISQPGNLLSLEVSSIVGSGENISNLTPLSLPALLTGGETTHATSVIVNANGDVVLTNSNTLVADTPGFAIASGNIDVSTTENIGGQINVLGSRVALIDANINANGINGGGQILIGGDFQGNGIVPNSQQTFINSNSIISADAINNGNGGRVIIWSDGITNFEGNISAIGGEFSGNGGFVEVSGKQQLIFDGNVNVNAAFGTPGTILLDPENVTVGASENTDNSEIAATKNTDSPTSETETVEQNSEVRSTENTENSETVESTENTDSEITENSDNSETETETETAIDPFAQDKKANVTISASNIGELSGDVILLADNDITVNEKIETTESVELKAGRSININADIDTSIGNGNIGLFGNDDSANVANRALGAASINQKEGTTLNAGSGNITIKLGNLGEIGDINLANLTTTEQLSVLVNANHGNIRQVSPNSLITADRAIFATQIIGGIEGNNIGGIGLAKAPLRINVNHLEASTGEKGLFIESISNLTIGGVSEELRGISTIDGGDIKLHINGNITATEPIETFVLGGVPAGNITIYSSGNIDTTKTTLDANAQLTSAGDISLSADGDIKTGIINAFVEGRNRGGNITINSGGEVDTTAGELYSYSRVGDGGNVSVISNGNLTTGSIDSRSESNGKGGNITLESTGGNVDTSSGQLASFSRGGDAGDVSITSHGDIKTANIFSSAGKPQDARGELPELPPPTSYANSNGNSSSRGSAGSITLKAEGVIDTTAGVLESFSRQGDGGNISLNTKGNISTGTVISSAGNPEDIPPPRKNQENTNTEQTPTNEKGSSGGNISIESTEGTVNTTQGDLISFSNKGDGGDITIISNGDINTADIDSRADTRGHGGNIFIESQTGAIDTLNGELASSSRTGDGGNVEIIGAGNIQVETIFSFSEGNGNGGDVSITSNSDIKTATIVSFAEGSGKGGDIYIIADGAIDTSVGELVSFSEQGKGGNVILSATGDITTGFIESFSASGVQGGNITLESSNGNIDTTVGFLGGEANISTDADVSSEDVAITFDLERANLSSYAPKGTGGNILIIQRGQGDITTSNISSFGGESSGAVNIINNDGNINTGAIFSTALNGAGGQISIETVNNGDLNINHIATYSAANNGTGGNIRLNASGIVNINNMASFGNAGSGDVSIQSSSGSINTGTIQTRASNGTSGNITLNTFSTQGDIRTAKVSTEGTEAAGKVEIIAPDGSVTTEDLKSSSESGNAGGIDVEAGDDIETGDQTVNSGNGESNINNQAGGDINTGNQTATTQDGNATVNNQAGGDINTGNQTATTQDGNATVNNQAGGDINTGNQTATTQDGNATVNNQAGGDINTGNQTATTQDGNATVNNQAGGNINTGNQTATTQDGNATVNNQAGGNINTGNQTAIAIDGNATVNNQAVGNNNTGNQIAIGNTTNITNQAGGENNTGEIIQISPPQSTLIENTLPIPLPQTPANITLPEIRNLVQTPASITLPEIRNLVQTPANPTLPTIPNRVQTPANLTLPEIRNLVQTPANPTLPPNNILPSKNPPLNSITANIIRSVRGNSNIANVNNPNLFKNDNNKINFFSTDTRNALRNINILNSTSIAANSQTLATIEQNRNNKYSEYFGEDFSTQLTSTKNIRAAIAEIARQTGKNSAIIYVSAYPEALQLVLYTPSGDPILKTIPQANREQLMEVVQQFRSEITNPARRNTQSYLPPAQKLYNWLIAPISAELETANINTLLFSMDEGLRALPVAALHDGQKFLIEKYSLSLIPSISLIDTNYRPLQNTQVLAMGASEFIQQNPLPAVPIELNTISQQLWQGSAFLNQDFTRNNLLTQRKNYPYSIIHLATHAEFKPGTASNSYIQLWGSERLQLDQIRQLGWNQPPVELLVLSACRTAVGDKNAELGFAGLAIAAGVKSALASVWYVSDEGTLGLMTEFYTHLNHVKIKAEALQQAQLAMLRGEVVIAEGELRGTGARGAVVLPSALGKFENQNLSHPYYWAGFTMIGSPW